MSRIPDSDFECRQCGRIVSLEQYRRSQFCPNCGTSLRLRRQPKPWVFQFNPALYRWLDRIKESKETEQWLTSQFANDIHEGDKVAIWACGDEAGIYAVGEIITGPKKRLLAAEQEKFWASQDDMLKFEDKYSVIIKYAKVIVNRPILQEVCSKDPVLSDMAVLKRSQGTNFPLTKEQWNRILELIDQESCK